MHKFAALALLVILASWATPIAAQDELDQGLTQLATKIAESSRADGKQKIAVVDFANLDGTLSAFGQHLAEALVTELFQVAPDKFEVVERRYLALVLREQKLTMNQLFEPQSLVKVGQLLGVDAIATGTISDIGDMVEINTRLISVESGMISAATRLRLRKLGTIQVLMGQSPSQQSSQTTAASPTGDLKKSADAVLARGIAAEGVVIEVVSAHQTGTKLRLELYATSAESNIDFSIWASYPYEGDTRAIDSAGNEHRAAVASLGNKSDERYVTAEPLVKGIRTRASLEFSGVDSPLANLALLEIRGSSKPEGERRQWDKWVLRLNDVPVN